MITFVFHSDNSSCTQTFISGFATEATEPKVRALQPVPRGSDTRKHGYQSEEERERKGVSEVYITEKVITTDNFKFKSTDHLWKTIQSTLQFPISIYPPILICQWLRAAPGSVDSLACPWHKLSSRSRSEKALRQSCRCLLKQAFGKSGNSACQGMEQSTNSTCYKSFSYKAAALNGQEIMGGWATAAAMGMERRGSTQTWIWESTRQITKEIIVMKKRVQSESQISRLCVRVDDGAMNWFRKYNKALIFFRKPMLSFRHTRLEITVSISSRDSWEVDCEVEVSM